MFTATLSDMEKRARRVLADNVRRLRKHKKYSQEELGRRAGIGQTTVSAIEDPEGKSIGIEIIEDAANALGIATYHLLIPDAPIEILRNHLIETVVSSTCAADPEGRTNIVRIAESEKRYSAIKSSEHKVVNNTTNH